MACSVKSLNGFDCFVLSGDGFVSVRVPRDVKLEDLEQYVTEEIQPSITMEGDDQTLSKEPILLVMRKKHDQTLTENHCGLESVPIRQNQSRLKQTKIEKDKSNESVLFLPLSQISEENFSSARDKLSLKGFSLYSYMWMTFQWIEPSKENNYKDKFRFRSCKVMRFIVALSLWAIVAFELYNLINGFPALVSAVKTFTAVVAFIHRLLWTFRYVVLYHIGLYYFCAHQEHIEDILNSSCVSTAQWKKIHSRVKDYMACAAFILLLLPLMQKLVPIFIQEAQRIPRTWDATVETVEFFVLVYSRVISMPMFFFVLLVVQTHLFELQNFSELLQRSRASTSELFGEYKSMARRIQTSSKFFQPFFAGLLFLLVIWGTLSVYSSVEMLQKVPPRSSRVYGVVISESLGTLIVFVVETMFLFSLPLYNLGHVNSFLKRLVFTVVSVDCEEQRKNGFSLSSDEKIEKFVSRLERYQNYGDVGFKVVGLQITELKSVWLSLLGPVIAFVGNFLLKEHF